MPIWEQASDWNNAQSESGVVHEIVSDTDNDDDTIVERGIGYENPIGSSSLQRVYPFQNDSGSPVDLINDQNGTIRQTVNQGVSGFLNGTTYEFVDPTGSVDVPSFFSGGEQTPLTFCFWIYFNQAVDSASTTILSDLSVKSGFEENGLKIQMGSGFDTFFAKGYNDGNGSNFAFAFLNSPLNTGQWYHFAVKYDPNSGDGAVLIDGDVKDSRSGSGKYAGGSNTEGIIAYDNQSLDFPDPGLDNAQITDFRYYDSYLSNSTISEISDIGNKPGTLTTSQKEF